MSRTKGKSRWQEDHIPATKMHTNSHCYRPEGTLYRREVQHAVTHCSGALATTYTDSIQGAEGIWGKWWLTNGREKLSVRVPPLEKTFGEFIWYTVPDYESCRSHRLML